MSPKNKATEQELRAARSKKLDELEQKVNSALTYLDRRGTVAQGYRDIPREILVIQKEVLELIRQQF